MQEPDENQAPDESLVRAFVGQSDKDALEILLRRHERQVYGLAYRVLGNKADAEDAMQEVFLNVFRKVRTFKHDSAFATWLHRLTVNACYDIGRKKARTPVPVEEVATETGDRISTSDTTIVIEGALQQLSLDHRVAITMRHLLDMTYEQISEATGVAVGTVKSRIARAREALAEILDPQIEEQAYGPDRLREKP